MIDQDPEPLLYDEVWARVIIGSYENDMMILCIGSDGTGLTVECVVNRLAIKPEIRAGPRCSYSLGV